LSALCGGAAATKQQQQQLFERGAGVSGGLRGADHG